MSNSLTEVQPWDTGSSYSWAWTAYLTTLSIGIILNGTVYILLTYRKDLKTLFLSHITRFLALQDFAFCLLCLCNCAANRAGLAIYLENFGCGFQAFHVSFFVLANGFSLCYIAHCTTQQVYRAISGSPYKLSFGIVSRMHLKFWAAAFVLSFLCNIWPGNYQMVSSGTYCMPRMWEWPSIVFFFITRVILMNVYMVHTYYKFYGYIKSLKIERESVVSKVRDVWKMLAFVLIFVTVWASLLAVIFYQWITQSASPPIFDIAAGVSIHFNQIMNPIMFVFLNGYVWQEIKYLWKVYVLRESVVNAYEYKLQAISTHETTIRDSTKIRSIYLDIKKADDDDKKTDESSKGVFGLLSNLKERVKVAIKAVSKVPQEIEIATEEDQKKKIKRSDTLGLVLGLKVEKEKAANFAKLNSDSHLGILEEVEISDKKKTMKRRDTLGLVLSRAEREAINNAVIDAPHLTILEEEEIPSSSDNEITSIKYSLKDWLRK